MATDLRRFTSTVAGVLLHCWTQPSWKVIQRNVTADNGKARAFILCKHKHEWICSNASTSLKNPMPVEHGRRKNFLQGGPKVVKFVFAHSKSRTQPFFLKMFKIQVGKGPPWPPSDAHECECDHVLEFQTTLTQASFPRSMKLRSLLE